MNKTAILLLAVMLSGALHAQNSRRMSRAAQEIYEITDPLLKGISMEVPEEYKGASAVGLASVSTENYEGNSTKRLRTSVYRILVKIQDKAARDEYSTFSIKSHSYRYFGYRDEKVYAIQIIKPSGDKMDVNVEELEKNADNEIAIPNLEIGDILDYGLKVVETSTDDCFSPRIQTLTDDFPIVYGFQRILVERGFFVNYMAANGAPELIRNEELSNRKNLVYELKYSDLNSASDEIWAPEYRTEATEKLQVCYYPIRAAQRAPYIFGDPYEIKTSSTQQEKERALKARYGDFVNFRGNDNTLYFEKWLKKNFSKDELSDDDYMKYAYYHYRYYTLIYSFSTQQYKSDYLFRYIKSKYFVQMMAYTAKLRNIPFEAVFTCDKNVSSLDDVLLMSEFSFLFRYKNEAGNWVYMETPTSYQTIDYVGDHLRGQDAFALDMKGDFQRIVIPESAPDENIYRLDFEITPNLDTKDAEVDVLSSTTGIFKYDFSPKALYQTEFYEDAQTSMLPPGQEDVMLEKGSAQRGMMRSEENVEVDPEMKLAFMKEWRSQDFDIDKYNSFSLINSGVRAASDSLKFQENYSIKNVVEKVGPTYVINLSKIALDQVSFTDKEKENRKNDIYINYPKTYSYTYRIAIPEGYAAHGIDTYNESVDSKYGKVEMTGTQVDNEVIIKLTKIYKQSFIPKSEWPALLKFLEPAMRINDARIVLKKV